MERDKKDLRATLIRSSHNKKRSPQFSPSSFSLPKSNDDPLIEYDYCMVLYRDETSTNTNDDNDINEISRIYLDHLTLVGIKWILIMSLSRKYIYVLLTAKLHVIRQLAIDLEYQFQLDPIVLQNIAEKGGDGILPIKIQHVPEESSLLPYHHIYAPYRRDSEIDQNLYWRPSNIGHPFRPLVRMKLTQLLIETKLLVPTKSQPTSPDTVSDSDGAVNIRRALLNDHIAGFFPLHHNRSRDHLAKVWLQPTSLPWQYPMDEIKEYFGEKIALYFDFMAHYTHWLLIPSLIGLPVQIICWSENNYNTPGQVGFACLLVIWAVCMLEFWKRKEKTLALKRGMLEYEDTEVDRPEFKGVFQPSHIDGKVKIYFPRHEKRRRFFIATLITLGCIGLVVGAVISIYILRATLDDEIGSLAQIISSIINAIQIQFFKYWYVFLADTMTEWENPRTDTEFEDAMIPKLYMFEFVNSYASFFYMAFIAPAFQDCASETCMAELGLNLIIIFGIRVGSGMLTEGLYPFYLLQSRLTHLYPFLEESGLNEIPPIDLQFNMADYDIVKDSLSEYAEIAIQFGYIVLFATALPLASFVGFICSVLETKIDAYKFLYLYKKPTVQGAQDIGNWQLIFTITTIIAVVTNAALIVFTMNYLDNHSLHFRFWFFCIFQWCIFGLLITLMEAIPDIPTEISIQLQRQKILVEKVIFRIKDFDQISSTDSNDITTSPPPSSTPSSSHFHIYDYHSFLQTYKQSPFTHRKQLTNMSQKLLNIQQTLYEEGSSEGDSSPNQTPTPSMPTIYSLPSSRKGKYSYSRTCSTLAGGSSRILDDSHDDDNEFFDNQA